MYLLDTNVLSELRKVGAGRCDPHVAEVMGASLYRSYTCR